MMNARNPKKAFQLKAILELLRVRGETGASSYELARASGSLAVSTCVSEIRQSGYNIRCKRVDLISGERRYQYRLVGGAP